MRLHSRTDQLLVEWHAHFLMSYLRFDLEISESSTLYYYFSPSIGRLPKLYSVLPSRKSIPCFENGLKKRDKSLTPPSSLIYSKTHCRRLLIPYST